MGRTPYDSRWRTIRLIILERDAYQCQIHGPRCTHTATEVDHIIPLNEGGHRLDPTNLRAACAQCNRGRGEARRAQLAHMTRSNMDAHPSRRW